MTREIATGGKSGAALSASYYEEAEKTDADQRPQRVASFCIEGPATSLIIPPRLKLRKRNIHINARSSLGFCRLGWMADDFETMMIRYDPTTTKPCSKILSSSSSFFLSTGAILVPNSLLILYTSKLFRGLHLLTLYGEWRTNQKMASTLGRRIICLAFVCSTVGRVFEVLGAEGNAQAAESV